ncbi:uncharacterized protein LOC126966741 [Leptidea sinapis]|uniref:uncharacterized protein LOC126966741 n=1 Tax=Leptidea sinapis TaxID=189913 RepID=UPI0021C4671C|nr:uncharacterized protein LOC126966741 [Leptidea sinapis]
MSTEDDIVPIDLLIDEIEKRDAIWNLNSKDYSNKILKRRSWEELVLIFCKNDDSEEKKKNLGSILQKKWKNLRDAYVKELKKTKHLKSGSSASTPSSFSYFQRLSFLKQVVQKRKTDNSLDVAEVTENPDLDSAVNSSGVQASTENVPRKKFKLHPADEHFANLLQQSINTRNNNAAEKKDDDEDKLFCLSLVREIKKVPENRRLKLKIEIYNLLERYQATRAQPLEDFNYPSTSYSSQRPPRNYHASFQSSQYSNPMQYSDIESTQYGYTTSSYTSPPTSSSQATSPPGDVTCDPSYEDSQELDLFN